MEGDRCRCLILIGIRLIRELLLVNSELLFGPELANCARLLRILSASKPAYNFGRWNHELNNGTIWVLVALPLDLNNPAAHLTV